MSSRVFFCALAFFFVLLIQGIARPALAENGRRFLSSFYKIDVFSPPLEVADLFFSRAGDAPPLQMTGYSGTWVVLNLWATWCAPCIAELPTLNRLARIQDDGVDVLAVSVDRKLNADRIGYYLKRWRVEAIEPLHDTAGLLSRRLDTDRLPVTYIVGPDGRARVALYGRAKWESDAAREFLAALGRDPEFFLPYVKK